MSIPNIRTKGRGAQKAIPNRFSKLIREREYTDNDIEELTSDEATQFIEVFPKTIVNKIKSPDLRYNYSLNPYQGCEHGCVYCYARNSHEYWGYGAGHDFEHKILVKKKIRNYKRIAKSVFKISTSSSHNYQKLANKKRH